jgi:hypothetical protein
MLRTSDIKHPDLAKAIEEGRPVELVGMDVTTNGTPDQRTAADCSEQTPPTWAQRKPWRPVPPVTTYEHLKTCCGCAHRWTHDLRQRMGLQCPSPIQAGVLLITELDIAVALLARQQLEKWKEAPKQQPAPTQPLEPLVGCPPGGSPTASEPLTTGCSHV